MRGEIFIVRNNEFSHFYLDPNLYLVFCLLPICHTFR
jgi:hypothetical protein